MPRWWRPAVLSVLSALSALATAACSRGVRGPDPLAVLPADRDAASPARLDSLLTAAEGAFRSGNWQRAQRDLERVVAAVPTGDPRSTRARFMLGETLLYQSNNLQAARELRRIADESPGDPLAPDALLRAGDAYELLWRRPELDPTYGQTAISTYQEVVTRFPNTAQARKAQLRVATLQDRFAYKGYRAGLFYYRLKAYESAILYFKDVVATYPRSTVAPTALVQLVRAYKAINFTEDAKETCEYMRRFHLSHPGVQQVCPATAALESPS